MKGFNLAPIDDVKKAILDMSNGGLMPTCQQWDEDRPDKCPSYNTLKAWGFPWSSIAKDLGLRIVKGHRLTVIEDMRSDRLLQEMVKRDAIPIKPRRINPNPPMENKNFLKDNYTPEAKMR